MKEASALEGLNGRKMVIIIGIQTTLKWLAFKQYARFKYLRHASEWAKQWSLNQCNMFVQPSISFLKHVREKLFLVCE